MRKKQLKRNNAIPLYYQLESILRRKILSGEILPGAALPSEDALGKTYGVSRITIRRTLSLLEQDGLIDRQRGRGTFVTEKSKSVELPRFCGSMETLISMGTRSTPKIIEVKTIEADDKISKRLKLKENQKVLMIEKVRMVEGTPLSHVINYLPMDLGQRILSFDLTKKPILTFLEEDLGVFPAEAFQTVEATVADAHVAPLLDIRVGDPLLKVMRTVYDSNRHPIEYLKVLYRADKYFLNVRLNRKRAENAEAQDWKPRVKLVKTLPPMSKTA